MIGNWNVDLHTILMIVLLALAAVYYLQGNKEPFEDKSESKALVPIRKRKLKSKSKKQPPLQNDSSNPVRFVMYYVPWCPHCKTTKPEWEKLEKDSKEWPWAEIETINCEDNPKEAEKNDIQYFPTLILTKDGKSEEYDGPRAYGSMKQFLQSKK